MQQAITTYKPKPSTDVTPTPNTVVNPTKEQQKGWSMNEKLIYGILGVVVIGGTIYLASRVIRNKIADKEEDKTFDEGGSATYAKQIKMAFENDNWPGTDTIALRSILRQIPSREVFDLVAKSYEKLYSDPTRKANLLRDLSDELQATEYNEMLQIINAKPLKKGQPLPALVYDAWAKRLKSAFDKTYGPLPGTDGDALIAVFTEIPTQAAFVKVGVSYQKMFGKSLIETLKSEGEFGQYMEWMKIIVAKKRQ